ncbi:MAG TPA: choice-of-anchor V domain-containing protein [Candidatus Limnocylindrales bacterium]|nr:choice-of-anchor V domain-containing protein [Candidatus Limnocylindrales bacterium]
MGAGRSLLSVVAITAALAAAPVGSALAVSTGPQPGSSGIPAGAGVEAEPTCISCHTSSALNPDDKGTITIEGVPAAYQPGKTYALTFRIAHPDPEVARWGFQVTAVSLPSLQGAGELVVTDSATTQLITGMVAGRTYLGHSYGGTAIGQSGGASWSFAWIAPAADAGKVAFFAVANAANADGSNQGDRIYSKSPEPIAVTEPAPPD